MTSTVFTKKGSLLQHGSGGTRAGVQGRKQSLAFPIQHQSQYTIEVLIIGVGNFIIRRNKSRPYTDSLGLILFASAMLPAHEPGGLDA